MPAAVRATLRAAGLRAQHRFSQNFLADPDVLEAILAEADPGPGRRILEIGPGLGLLTAGLLAAGATVTAVELDRGLAAFLRERFDGPMTAGGPPPGRGRRARPGPGQPGRAALRRRRQPAVPHHQPDPPRAARPPAPAGSAGPHGPARGRRTDRGAAGKMSYLSVFVQYHARVRIAFGVPPAAFEPEPAVESAVIVVEPYDADDRLDAGGRGRPVAAGPGRLPRAPQDDPQRAVAAAAGRAGSRRRRAGRGRTSTPTGVPRRWRSASGWPSTRPSVRSGPTVAAGRRSRRRDGSCRRTPTRRLAPVVRLAPAKLNLTLAIVGRRPDGFHVLHSVFVPLGLADRLSLSPAAGGSGHAARGRVRRRAARATTWSSARSPRRGSRSAAAWPGGPGPAPSLAARLEKHIPVAAGLAGGSSDAAAALDGSLEAWRRELDSRRAAGDRRPASARTSRSSWPAARPSSRGAARRWRRCSGSRSGPGVLLVTPAIPVATPGGLRGVRRPRWSGQRIHADVVGASRRGASLRADAPPTWSPGPAC